MKLKEKKMPIGSCFRSGVSVLLALHISLAFGQSAQSKVVDSKSNENKSNSQQNNAESSKPEVDKTSKKSEQNTSTSEGISKDLSNIPPIYKIELDKKTYKLINQGQWKQAATRLEKLTNKDKYYSRNSVWLAFAYMFFNQKDKLDSLIEGLDVEDNPDSQTYKMIVEPTVRLVMAKRKKLPNY